MWCTVYGAWCMVCLLTSRSKQEVYGSWSDVGALFRLFVDIPQMVYGLGTHHIFISFYDLVDSCIVCPKVESGLWVGQNIIQPWLRKGKVHFMKIGPMKNAL